jgi:hypothetical protein
VVVAEGSRNGTLAQVAEELARSPHRSRCLNGFGSRL